MPAESLRPELRRASQEVGAPSRRVHPLAVSDSARWERLREALERRNMGRLTVDVTVTDEHGARVGRLAGVFAAMPEPLDE